MYIGLDVHKKMSYYSMVDRQGTEVKKGRFPTTREGLNEFASTLPEGAKVAIEASTSGIFVYEYLDGKRIDVHLAHPVYVKPFAKKHVKTDKVDARVLAQLLRMDYLPESYVPGEDMRDLRTIVRHRASLVRLRTSIKNALLALSEIGEIERFSKPKSFVSYAGLAPKVEQSGDYTRYGHINKHSNGFLRWALIQSTRAAVHSATPNRFQRIYNRLKARRGEKVAIVATARHMAESVLLGTNKEGILQRMKEGNKSLVFFMIP